MVHEEWVANALAERQEHLIRRWIAGGISIEQLSISGRGHSG